MAKKKIIIIGAVLVIVALIASGIILFSNKPKKHEKNDVPYIEELPEVTEMNEVLANIELSLGDKRPTLENFGFDSSAEGELKIYFDDELYEEETLNKLGVYKVVMVVEDLPYISKIEVLDKENPILKLKNISIKNSEPYSLNDFVESCSDNSEEECILVFTKDEMGKYTKVGSYDIEVSAKDSSGNETIEKAKLTITENKTNNSNNTTNTTTNNSNNTNNTTNNNSSGDNQNNSNNQTNSNNSNNNQNSNNESSNNNTNNEKEDIVSQATKYAAANTAQVNEVLKYTNDIRTKLGLPNLTLSSSLTKAAMVRAIEISTKFSHTRPNGQSYSSVFKELSISVGYSGENIAAGRSSAKTTVDDWENSPGHYANMVNTNYTKMGVGYVYIPGTQYKYYWVQLFSS